MKIKTATDITQLPAQLNLGEYPLQFNMDAEMWEKIEADLIASCEPGAVNWASWKLLELYTLRPTSFPQALQDSSIKKRLLDFLKSESYEIDNGFNSDRANFLQTSAILAVVYGQALPDDISDKALAALNHFIRYSSSVMSVFENITALLAGKLLFPHVDIPCPYTAFDVDRSKIEMGNWVNKIKATAAIRLLWPELFAQINIDNYSPLETIARSLERPDYIVELLWAFEIIYAEQVSLAASGIRFGEIPVETNLPDLSIF